MHYVIWKHQAYVVLNEIFVDFHLLSRSSEVVDNGTTTTSTHTIVDLFIESICNGITISRFCHLTNLHIQLMILRQFNNRRLT